MNSIKLHLGAFDCSVDGWVNTDVTPHIWISKIPLAPLLLFKLKIMPKFRYDQHLAGVFRQLKYLDLCKKLPFQENSIDAIFSSHVFEHLFMDEVNKLIVECFRVLKPGGVCRVVVPDLEKIISSYSAEDPTRFILDIYEVASRSAVKNSHHSAFTGSSLTKLFAGAGFSKCMVVQYLVGICPDIYKLDNRPDSLFFEAIK